jgi:hypothetical protein
MIWKNKQEQEQEKRMASYRWDHVSEGKVLEVVKNACIQLSQLPNKSAAVG